MKLNVRPEGLEDLKRTVNDPSITGTPTRGVLLKAGNRGKKVAMKESDGGLGKIPQTIIRAYDRENMEVIVKSVLENTRSKRERLMSIEGGRPPSGPLPNTVAIARWMRAEGMNAEADAVSRMAHQIKDEGAEGKRMFEKALEDIQGRMPKWVQTAAKQIAKRWEKKHGAGTAPPELGL